MMQGLIIGGRTVLVPGVRIENRYTAAWAQLGVRDCRPRSTTWVRQVVLHTTKGDWPQTIKPGAGPTGKAQLVDEFWSSDPTHSGAHIVIGSDGVAACLADCLLTEAYHATCSNPWSVGIEIYQEAGGVVFGAALDAAVAIVRVLCAELGIQYQTVGDRYAGQPMHRLAEGGASPGGPGVVGIYGHRANTGRRGRGDPGEEVFARLVADGCEAIITDAGGDLVTWQARQLELGLVADGVPGPLTVAALKAAGWRSGIRAFGKV